MLPIHSFEQEILASLRAGNRLVLTAPTGSGKTTQVPQMLFGSGLCPGQIVVLQPRRLATRLVAQRVAYEMKSPVGQLVGYQTRHDSRICDETRIRFVTEGIFLRLLQSDPALPGIGAVVLDEFHERSLAADTVLAMLRVTQSAHRPDLKLVVMSATLDAVGVSAYLNCPSVTATGRTFPVDVRYLSQPSSATVWDLAADALGALLSRDEEGDVLIFMPGRYEIRRTIDACSRYAGEHDLALLPLHGELPPAEQDAAMSARSQRRVIVSTNVAETSITIDGVRHVIDAGLARVNRFDPRRGINVLLVEPISRASADQRAGRAGRTAPGTCLRLWTEAEHRSRVAHETPEVQRLDLAQVLLQLHDMGVDDVASFPWLQPPPALAIAQATDVLKLIGAVGADNKLTSVGSLMARFPTHPRIARLLVEAARRGVSERAATWAALLGERDILLREQRQRHTEKALENDGPRTDFLVLENALSMARGARFDPGRCAAMGVQGNACREIDKTAQLLREACEEVPARARARVSAERELPELLRCLLLAFPDHVAMRRSGQTLACGIVGNRRGELDPATVAQHVGPVLALDIREVGAGGGVKTVLSLVSELEHDWLAKECPERFAVKSVTLWNDDRRAVERVERVMFDDLILDEKLRAESSIDLTIAAELLAEQIVAGRLVPNKWDASVEQWIARTRCASAWFPERRLISYDKDDLSVIAQEICAGAVRWSQVEDRPCLNTLRDALSWDDQQFVEKMAPERIELPGGFKMKVEYQLSSPPKGRAKIQDFYGLTQTPTVAAGRQRVVLEILGPNYRPLQTTEDLAGFWANLYPTLRKELARKYPRHEWR
jgi:ATP-dependent helicase HrpB